MNYDGNCVTLLWYCMLVRMLVRVNVFIRQPQLY